MTCIVGLEHDGKVYIGADSAGVAGSSLTIRADQKAFVNGPIAFGFTSSFRMGQILQYELKIPAHIKSKTDMDYLVTTLVKEIRKCFEKGGYLSKADSQESGGTFLLGYNKKLYCVDSDFQVGKTVHGYDACGSGSEVALGSLHTHMNLNLGTSPEEIVKSALTAAAYHITSVAPPFTVVSV